MNVKQTVKKLSHRWNHLSLNKRVIISGIFVLLAGYGLLFGFAKQVTFAYTGQDCTPQLTLLPSLMKQSDGATFKAQAADVFTVAGFPLASLKTCFTPVDPPKPGNAVVAVSPFGSWFMAKKFSIQVGDPPSAKVSDFVGKTLPVTRPIEIALSGHDEVFEYKLKIGEKAVDCDHDDSKLSCDITSLDLAQGEKYSASLSRYFEDKKIADIGEGEFTTLRALALVSGSVSDSQTIYDKPASFTFEYDKELDIAEATLKTKDGQVVAAKVSTDEKRVIITPEKELTRNAEFVLTLEKVEAIDGSAIPDPVVINFTMSGGPKVVSISVGSTGVATSGTITITFDQDVANFDAASSLVVSKGLNAQPSGSGKTLSIRYTADLCVDFSITVKKGFKSTVDISQSEDWSFAGRTTCYTVQTIGYSVRGRAINAFIFGSGSKTILYTGAIHGNEQSSRLLMNAWISELNVNARSIPAGTRIVVIPSVSPDGVAANTRTNANNVDLNRNYNTSDWKSDVETVNGDSFPGGGGSAPGSEPETQALMAYTMALAPRLTMSYHASASYAIGNTCGDSAALAQIYADLTGYRNMTGVSGAFSYQITGTYDDWMCERLGRTSVLIELASSSSPEFSRNKAAMWAMARS